MLLYLLNLPITTYLIIFGLYFAYSVYGYLQMTNYMKECTDSNNLPFNNSIFKMVVASLFSGFFTTWIMVAGIVWSTYHYINNTDIYDSNEKKPLDEVPEEIDDEAPKIIISEKEVD